jgi:hypothetical protein
MTRADSYEYWYMRKVSAENINKISTRERAVHCKKSLTIFPSPVGMSLTKLSLDVNNLLIPVQGQFGK